MRRKWRNENQITGQQPVHIGEVADGPKGGWKASRNESAFRAGSWNFPGIEDKLRHVSSLAPTSGGSRLLFFYHGSHPSVG